MFPADCLNEYWIYKLPDGTRVVAELKEDGFWWLWQYWRIRMEVAPGTTITISLWESRGTAIWMSALTEKL